jgi:small-conductance mechanosensitive channel
MTNLQAAAASRLAAVLGWLQSPLFYVQVAAIAAAILIAWTLAGVFKRRLLFLVKEPEQGRALRVRRLIFTCRDLVLPILTVAALAMAVALLEGSGQPAWLARIAQGLASIYVLYVAINRFILHAIVNLLARWIALPVALLLVLGYFNDFTVWLDTLAFSAGNIRISVLALAKAAIFGGILFWLGRLSTTHGQRAIRGQEALDTQTRELAAKVWEIAIYFLVAVLLLNILGLDLTTLAVFGGALGVGLGFGLQQIAANFISGIIILLERQLKIGDFIEMEDGKSGLLKEINMRFSTVVPGDGREFMVPNEKFVTGDLTNYTRTDRTHRHQVTFHVPYEADLRQVPELIVKAVAAHPAVLKPPHAPACNLLEFGAHGVGFQATYWVESQAATIMKSHGSEMRFLIWEALKGAGIALKPP